MGWEGTGLRVSISELAKSVCVTERGCLTGPQGAVSIKPLDPKLREAISDALATAGFELVTLDAERDLLVNVEWRGTDTIALRLQDVHGRLIDETSYRRDLSHCRELPDLTWDSCWAANFEAMKAQLASPLRQSPRFKTFALKLRGYAEEPAGTTATRAASPADLTGGDERGKALLDHLDDAVIAATLNAHQGELRQACFQPAYEARADHASGSARVSTVITIAASGRVESVATGEDPPGYLHLASCVAKQVRSWRFPAARRSTTSRVPFIFASE